MASTADGDGKTDKLFRSLLAASKQRHTGNEPIAWKLQKQKEERQRAIDVKLNQMTKQKTEIDEAANAIDVRARNFYESLTVVTEIMDQLIWESVCGYNNSLRYQFNKGKEGRYGLHLRSNLIATSLLIKLLSGRYPPLILNDKKLDEVVDRLSFDGLLDGNVQHGKGKARRPNATQPVRPHRVEEE